LGPGRFFLPIARRCPFFLLLQRSFVTGSCLTFQLDRDTLPPITVCAGLALASHAPTTSHLSCCNKADPRFWCSFCTSSFSSMVAGKEACKEITSFGSCLLHFHMWSNLFSLRGGQGGEGEKCCKLKHSSGGGGNHRVLQPRYYHQLEADASDTRLFLVGRRHYSTLRRGSSTFEMGGPTSTPQQHHTSSSPKGACSPAARKMDGDGVRSAVATRDRIEFSLSFIGSLCLFLGPSCNFFIF
jgi:hypothetical protein